MRSLSGLIQAIPSESKEKLAALGHSPAGLLLKEQEAGIKWDLISKATWTPRNSDLFGITKSNLPIKAKIPLTLDSHFSYS